jgi:hypothetical protein
LNKLKEHFKDKGRSIGTIKSPRFRDKMRISNRLLTEKRSWLENEASFRSKREISNPQPAARNSIEAEYPKHQAKHLIDSFPPLQPFAGRLSRPYKIKHIEILTRNQEN